MKYTIILASGSPRRRELMERIGSSYICIPSGKEEDMSGHDPKVMVEMLSSMKAEDIADKIINNTLQPEDIRSKFDISRETTMLPQEPVAPVMETPVVPEAPAQEMQAPVVDAPQAPAQQEEYVDALSQIPGYEDAGVDETPIKAGMFI